MSMDFYASKQEGDGVYGPVFGWNHDDATTVNVSNSNADVIVETLGYTISEASGSTFFEPIDEFIERAQKWLDANPWPSPLTPLVIEEEAGRPTFFHCGRAEGYLQRQIGRLLDLAVYGRKAGATHVFGG